MTWKEVRIQYPNQWVKLLIIKNHIDDNKEYIDEMDVITPIPTDLEAGRELDRTYCIKEIKNLKDLVQ
ncbi:MAG: hypothetical protein Q8942_18805 [Bacillota bacterium]|nr:hypothetical protein [Bacillota bacterium]